MKRSQNVLRFVVAILVVISSVSVLFSQEKNTQPDSRLADPSAQAIRKNPHAGPAWDFSHGPLQVSEDGHSLVHEDGTPFLWIGDTAWEMVHRLTREEMEFFLEKRRSQAFTVIQTVLLAEFEGLIKPNPNGHLPLVDNDPARPDVKDGPDNDYWDDVDFMVKTAADKGLYVALLPTWGDKVLQAWGQGPVIFNETNAEKYGEFLGKRYADAPNVLWVLGGDRVVKNEQDTLNVWRAMSSGILKGDHHKHLQTYHPQGGTSSSHWLHNEKWLDFNMFQSGHSRRDEPNYRFVQADFNRTPPKPTLDGEPCYENHPINWDVKNGHFDDFDVRQAAYWSLFAGSFGHTYGSNDIWQMYDGRRGLGATPNLPWNQSVDLPGAWQMLVLRRFLLTENLLEPGRVPFQELIVSPNPEEAGHLAACCSKDRKRAYVYAPTGRDFRIDVSLLNTDGADLKYVWFNPRNGETQEIASPPVKQADGKRILGFSPPGDEKRGNDWVLMVRSAWKLPEKAQN